MNFPKDRKPPALSGKLARLPLVAVSRKPAPKGSGIQTIRTSEDIAEAFGRRERSMPKSS